MQCTSEEEYTVRYFAISFLRHKRNFYHTMVGLAVVIKILIIPAAELKMERPNKPNHNPTNPPLPQNDDDIYEQRLMLD